MTELGQLYSWRTKRPRVLLVQRWWWDQVFAGVARYAAEHHWILDCQMKWTNKLPSSNGPNPDGIIAYVGEFDPAPAMVEYIQNAKVPVVDLATHADNFGAPRVYGSDQERGRLAAEHLLAIGLRHFAFATIHKNIYQTERLIGFKKTVEAAGHTCHVVSLEDLPQRIVKLPTPMGILTMNDLYSLEVIQICQEQGYHVPEQFAVIGVDDMEILCDFAPVSLSSVNCNHAEIGYQASALLDRLMKGGTASSMLIPAKGVTARASTDTIGIPDLATSQALQFLRRNHSKPIRIEDMPPELKRSLRTIQRTFKAHTGKTLVQELTRLRVEHAKVLLAQTNEKMSTVAAETGFSSLLYFIWVFKKATGLTPKAFQRQVRREA